MGNSFFSSVFEMVLTEQNADLTRSFQLDEFTVAIQQSILTKPPGMDGFNPVFFSELLEHDWC